MFNWDFKEVGSGLKENFYVVVILGGFLICLMIGGFEFGFVVVVDLVFIEVFKEVFIMSWLYGMLKYIIKKFLG